MSLLSQYKILAGIPSNDDGNRLLMEKKTFEVLRQKPADQLTPEQRDFLVSRAKLPFFQAPLASDLDTAGVSPELQRFAVFEGDLPRKAGKDMGEILRLRALFNEKITPEALQAVGVQDKKLIGLPIEALYTGGFAIEPAQAAKVAVVQWGLTGNNPGKLFTELPTLKLLTTTRGNDSVRQRLRDSIDQSVKFYNKGITSSLRSPYTKTLYNHVIEGNAPEDVSLLRDSGRATTDVPVLSEVNPYIRTLSEASRESFERPDEFWANKPTPYTAPETPGQAVREALIGTIPSFVMPDMSGTPSDLLQNLVVAPGLSDAYNTTQKIMANPLTAGLKGLNTTAKAAEPALASIGAAATVDDYFKAISSAKKGKALSKAMVEEALNAGNIPEFLAPFVSKTPSGKVILEITPEAAAALKLDPAQAKLLSEVNYAEKLKTQGPALEDWEASKIMGEASSMNPPGKSPSVIQAEREKARAQSLLQRKGELAETGPRPTFEPGPEFMTTVRGEPVRMTKEEVLGMLQNGRAAELPDEVFELASKSAKGKKAVSLKDVPLDVPVVNEASTRQIAQQALLGNKLTKEQELYMQLNSDEVLAAMQQERNAAKVLGEAGSPPPAVQQAAKEVEQAQATAASTAQNVDEAAEAARIKSTLPPASGADEPKKGFPWLKTAGYGTAGAAVGVPLYNALTSARESVDARNVPPASPVKQEVQKPLSPEESALMRRFGIIPFGESGQAPQAPQAMPQAQAMPATQAEPYEEARMMVGSPEATERAKRESVLVEPEKSGFDWKGIIGGLANAVAQGAEAYNTGVDPRRAWQELALRQRQEAKVMPQMDAAAMQDFYQRRQMALEAQNKREGYGFNSMRDMMDYKQKLAQELYMKNMQGKSQQEQQDFLGRMQLIDQLNR